MHPRYSKLHESWKTPYIAIGIIWLFGIILLYASSYLPTINDILQSSIAAIGFQISFYLGLTGFACAWYYRKKLCTKEYLAAITHVIWPAFSGIFLFFIAVYSVPTFDLITNVVGIGGILIGIIPFGLGYLRNKKTLTH